MKLTALGQRDPAPAESAPASPGPTPPWRRLLRVPRPRSLREALQRNTGLKLVSLLLAFFLWFSINVSERDAERIVELPVSVRRLGPSLIVTNPPVKPVAVTLRGPRTILDGVDERKARLALDLTNAGPGDLRLELDSDLVRPELPRRLKVVRLDPARLKIHVERLARRTIPVRVDLAGMPAFGYTVAESHAVPDRVEVSGPAGKLDELKEITTEPIDLRGMNDPLRRTVLLAWAGDFVSFVPDHVDVTVTFEEVMVSREFHHVEVHALRADGVRVQITPPWIDFTVRGPQRLLHNYKLPEPAALVDAQGLLPGSHRVSVRVDLPPALEVVRRQPELHTVQVGGGR